MNQQQMQLIPSLKIPQEAHEGICNQQAMKSGKVSKMLQTLPKSWSPKSRLEEGHISLLKIHVWSLCGKRHPILVYSFTHDESKAPF